ncbi:MAG: hypothetical protein QXU18_01270 [Thermoplasmatales archaeon]
MPFVARYLFLSISALSTMSIAVSFTLHSTSLFMAAMRGVNAYETKVDSIFDISA